METQGGSVQVDSENMHSAFGLGWHDGLRTGFLAETTFDDTKVSLGDEIIPFVLPTDIFDTSYYVWGRGIGLRRALGDGDALIFAGYTSESLNTPFVNTASPDDPVAAFFYRHPVGEHFKFSSYNLVSGRLTSIQSLEWIPIHDLSFAASAGVGYQEPYGAISARLHRNKIDVWASESDSTDSFRRIRLVSPLMTEQKGAKVIALIEEMRRDNPLIANRVDLQADAMSTPADPTAVIEAFKETHGDMMAAPERTEAEA